MFGWLKNILKSSKSKQELTDFKEINIGTQYRAEYNEPLKSYLEKVFYEKAYGEYCAATLFVNQEMMNMAGEPITQGTQSLFLNIADNKLDPEVRYWVCLCYIKYKGNKNQEYFSKAMDYVTKYDEIDAAKKLLVI